VQLFKSDSLVFVVVVVTHKYCLLEPRSWISVVLISLS